MANICTCTINISGDAENIKRLSERLKNDEFKKGLHLSNYHLLFDSVEEDSVEWGSKWMTIDSSDLEDESISLYADSAWNPPFGLLQKISEQYNLFVECDYSEPGCDIAGTANWDNGVETLNEEKTYLEYYYEKDTDYFWDEVGYRCEYDTIESVIESLGDIYNNFSEFEISKLNEIHSQNYCGDED